MAASQKERYVEVMGEAALERVLAQGASQHPCCWEPKDGPHHQVCRKYVPVEEPVIHEAQASLL